MTPTQLPLPLPTAPVAPWEPIQDEWDDERWWSGQVERTIRTVRDTRGRL